MVFGFHERIAQNREGWVLRRPQVERKGTRNLVDLVNEELTLWLVPEQVNANDALQASDLSNGRGQPGRLVMDSLWRLRGKLPGSMG